MHREVGHHAQGDRIAFSYFEKYVIDESISPKVLKVTACMIGNIHANAYSCWRLISPIKVPARWLPMSRGPHPDKHISSLKLHLTGQTADQRQLT